MAELYSIRKTYEGPTGRIGAGVAKTEDEWMGVFPNLEKGDCKIKDDWFESVGNTIEAGKCNCTLCGVMPSAFVATVEGAEYILIENKRVPEVIMNELREKYDICLGALHKMKIVH